MTVGEQQKALQVVHEEEGRRRGGQRVGHESLLARQDVEDAAVAVAGLDEKVLTELLDELYL